MRIAVATIAKDEAKHAERWAASAADADGRFVLDTGSTDGTQALLTELGVTVYEADISPWRFDRARNRLLEQMPDDIDVVVTLDMDEVLVPGWRESIEAAGPADRYTYDYVWSWENGQPAVQFRANRCHRRKGYHWKHPVHEVLDPYFAPEKVVHAGFAIHHHADDSKPRTQYLPLLEMAVAEAPDDDRQAHYYARELFFAGDWVKAREEFVRHLALPSAVWPDERCESYRYLAAMDDYPERWLLRACAEAPHRREPWVDLARLYEASGEPVIARGAAARALRITNRTGAYMEQESAWDDALVAAIGQEG